MNKTELQTWAKNGISLYDEFRMLMEEEDRIVQQRELTDWGYAYISCPEPGRYGCWVTNLTTERLLEWFELLATKAGIALGARPGTSPVEFWLYRLFLDLRAINSPLVRFSTDTGGFIDRVAEAAVIDSSRLNRQVLLPTPPTEPAANYAEFGTSLIRKRGPKPDHETALKVAEIVARVAGEMPWSSRLEDICTELDEERVPRPKTWRRRGTEDWFDCLRERPLVQKAITHHLKLARQFGNAAKLGRNPQDRRRQPA